jgi:type I restriction enzyme, R subunit
MDFSEDFLIEQPTIALFSSLGWETANCFEESFGPFGTLGRETSNEVVLVSRLMAAIKSMRVNRRLPQEALQMALNELTRDRSLMSIPRANRQVYQLLKEGVPVNYRNKKGEDVFDRVYLIDWNNPENNDFFLASQFWVSGDIYKRRPDLIGFINGIPLVFIELKASHVRLENAYRGNLQDYKDTIPHLFWYTGFIILSNGSEAKVGTVTSPWEHFSEWKKINSEGEEGVVSLETVIRGTCQPERALDILENFILYAETGGGLAKLVAKYHQYLGVNNAYDSIQNIRKNQGKLGVFWHTQGSGKSYSMIFFAQKVLRKLAGNWTFVVVTDRRDLDDQIYKNFAGVNAVTEPEERVRANSGEHLKQLLREDHRYVFTLIHKFHTETGETYPTLSERDNIIVLTDEAHRSQYDVLALNMRNALPNAAFLAFTGTPLMATEERTKQVFGDYVSIYNFAQSVEDDATVPLYYENRIPQLQLTNENLNEDMERLLEDAEIDERQEKKLEREFSREYHLVTREERLEKIAEDLVNHFMGRGFQGKAMVVSIDKATTLKMYNKVKKYWSFNLSILQAELSGCDDNERPDIEQTIKYMQETDMAVVISQGQNEIAEMREKGLDIRPHRERMVREDLDTKFKDSDDPFRIVFVCAMWMTGFDVPSCSTIYLDKPMRNHTLMQTIARANRVWGEKVNGLIVDYIGVFRDLQRALAIYGTGSGGGIEKGDMPVATKQALIDALGELIVEVKEYLKELDVDLEVIHQAEGYEKVSKLDDAVNAILVDDETKRDYLSMGGQVDRLFKAILPDKAANQFGQDRKAIVVIKEKIQSLLPAVDISTVMDAVNKLLDESIVPDKEGYVIIESGTETPYLDLSKINFDALKRQFERSRKNIEAEKLRGALNQKLMQMVRLNKSRTDYYEKFKQLVDEYNKGAKSVDRFYVELLSFAQDLSMEEQRGISEKLTEEELALFDILTKPNVKLTQKEKEQVKAVAKELLETLKRERLVLDWRKHQQTRAAVELKIQQELDKLPEVYDKHLYDDKCIQVYQHVYDSYYGAGKSIYPVAW